MSTVATLQPFTREDEVLAAIMGSFLGGGGDGWLYPRAEGEALVRVRVGNGMYQVQRRRKPGTVWMTLVTADVADFSEPAFDTWVSGWALTE